GLVAEPALFEKAARYLLPLCDAVSGEIVSVALWALASGSLPQVAPPSLETCHWIEGEGRPSASAVNDAEPPAGATTLAGLRVTSGRVRTSRRAGELVASPAAFVNTAR